MQPAGFIFNFYFQGSVSVLTSTREWLTSRRKFWEVLYVRHVMGLKTTKKFISTKPIITFFGHERVEWKREGKKIYKENI